MAGTPPHQDKPVHWIGPSKSDLLALPQEVVSDMGYALGVAQLGGKHPDAKPWKGEGPGVLEIVERFEGVVYVLHVFQKKSPSGIRTAQTDVDLVHERLKRAREHYESNYTKLTKGKAGKHGK